MNAAFCTVLLFVATMFKKFVRQFGILANENPTEQISSANNNNSVLFLLSDWYIDMKNCQPPKFCFYDVGKANDEKGSMMTHSFKSPVQGYSSQMKHVSF